ncbi:MAG: aspartate aminotransferase family protein, partial [Methanobacteriota archaeon]
MDCGVSHGACNLGHAHPEVVRAIREQAGRLLLVDSTVRNDARAAFLEALFEILPDPLARTFLCNSGAEAVEAALKFARSATGRPRLVAAYRGFHGRTYGALSVTWKKEHRDAFGPLLADVDFVPFNDDEALKEAVGPSTAAVVLEPVQGEGGVHVASSSFLRTASDLCRDRGALLVLDEVQTGLGRTGRLFAFERAGVVPDVLCLAKSLAGGFPIGATVVTEAVHRGQRAAHHSTFGGNPLACAAGAASLRVLVRDRL